MKDDDNVLVSITDWRRVAILVCLSETILSSTNTCRWSIRVTTSVSTKPQHNNPIGSNKQQQQQQQQYNNKQENKNILGLGSKETERNILINFVDFVLILW